MTEESTRVSKPLDGARRDDQVVDALGIAIILLSGSGFGGLFGEPLLRVGGDILLFKGEI